jgi:chaperonin GroEL
MELKAGIEKAGRRRDRGAQEAQQAGQGQDDRPGRDDLGERRQTIGNIIAEAMEKVGKDGVITVEESKSMETSSTSWRGCGSTAATCPPTS